MVTAMSELCPDVKVKVEAAMMLNWDKKAKPVYGPDGHRLRLWTPDILIPDPDTNKLVPVSYIKKEQVDKVKAWKKNMGKERIIAMTPEGCRPLFEHGGEDFHGYQPLKSVPDPELI